MKLEEIKVAILLCDGFEETEMTKPKKALEKEKATVHLITPQGTHVRSWKGGNWHRKFPIDHSLKNLDPEAYDALVLPGGVLNPDKLRTYPAAIQFIDHFFKKNKLIAAICHGPLTLIETNRLKARRLTSYHSIQTDLVNAGANWANKSVIIDHNLITSRTPDDLIHFNKALVKGCYRAIQERKSLIKSGKKFKRIANKRFINC